MISERGFCIVPNEEAETQEYLKTLSKVTGVSVNEIDLQELKNLLNEVLRGMLGGPPNFYIRPLTLKYQKGIASPDPVTRELFAHFAYAALNSSSTLSYGTALHFYCQGLLRYASQSGDKGPHVALLTGAYSSVSMFEFVAAVRGIFPNATCLTVDPAPTDKMEKSSTYCQFFPYDACDLPFGTVFDTIHTSGLLDHLGSTNKMSLDFSVLAKLRKRYFESTAQVLKPGGLIMMVERSESISGLPISQPYMEEMRLAGFKNATSHPLRLLGTRRYIDRCLKNTALHIPEEYLEDGTGLVGITATI